MINVLCDTILPGDEELGLPSAETINIKQYIHSHDIGTPVEEYLKLLDQLALDEFGELFVRLDASVRLQIVELSKRKNNRLANMIILHCMKAYYTDANVLKRLPVGAVPPFPAGNFLEEDDWSLLDKVYEGGRIYRSVSS